LINPATGSWDRDLIEEVFWEEDRMCILGIAIKHGMEDLIAWHYDKKGFFSVKSAYHTILWMLKKEERHADSMVKVARGH
jgi:hypothetical protein